MESQDWPDALRVLSASVERGLATLEKVRDWAWRSVVASDVIPLALPDDLAALFEELLCAFEATKQQSGELLERLSGAPNVALVMGRLLTREQYHALAAQGVALLTHKTLGLSDCDDYELFCQFWYEDNERRGYINPEFCQRQPGTVGIRVGICPDDVWFDRLRPEQRVFFGEHLPELAQRFKRDHRMSSF